MINMSIDIKNIAKLSMLRIEDEKVEKFKKDMEAIINMVDRLPNISGELGLDYDNVMTLRKILQFKISIQEMNFCKMHLKCKQVV